MDKISVIVPVYNAQKYLSRCIDSILNQTYSNIELILVDDGSTDESQRVCLAYAENDKRISYVYQDNTGPDYARKKGVAISTGEYLFFVDADDYIASDMIERLYQQLIERDCDIVCSQFMRIDNEGKTWGTIPIPDEGIECNLVCESMHHFFVTRYVSGSYPTKLYRREILEDYNFAKDSLIGEDITAVLYALQKAKKVYIMKDALYYYFWNGKSISHSGYTERHLLSLFNYIEVRDKLLLKNYIEPCYICGFFAEYEMAVATAMSRNWNRDTRAINILKDDLCKNIKFILGNTKTALYMKLCIVLYSQFPNLFMILYRGIYMLTGR